MCAMNQTRAYNGTNFPAQLGSEMDDNKVSLLAMFTLSAVQSSAQTFFHNAILFIDTSNND